MAVRDNEKRDLLKEYIKENPNQHNRTHIAKDLCRDYPAIFTGNIEKNRTYISKVMNNILMYNHTRKLSKSRQKFMDENRIERKKSREEYRIENALEAWSKKIFEKLEGFEFSSRVITHKKDKGSTVGVIQLSDLHLNELVDLPHNKYNFKIASARLKLFASRAKEFFKSKGITHCLLAMTSDCLNSDRRIDELLSQATNRSLATILSVEILQQFIMDLNKDFNLTVAYVAGNESRAKQEMSWSTPSITDNYDTVIFFMLRGLLAGKKGIEFIYSAQSMELVVKVGPLNFLLTHGLNLKGKMEDAIEKTQGRYINRDIKIDYIISGHLHSAYVSSIFSRSGSLVGSNSYSEIGLNLYGRASQNLYAVYGNGLRDAVMIDLQLNDDSDRYMFDESLEAYNPKSESKLHEHKTIFEVII